jgi:hypothetical protein
MTAEEDRRTELYEAAGTVEDEWEAPTRPASGRRRRLESIISVRFSSEEIERVRAAAEAADTPVSAYIRTAALKASEEHAGPDTVAYLAHNSTSRNALNLTFFQSTAAAIETGGSEGLTVAATG